MKPFSFLTFAFFASMPMVLSSCALFSGLKSGQEGKPPPSQSIDPNSGEWPVEAGVATHPDAGEAPVPGKTEEPEGAVPDGIYSFKNVMSGKCLEFQESGRSDDPPVQKRCRLALTQSFVVKRSASKNIYSLRSRSTEKYMQIRALVATNGGQAELAAESSNIAQRFAFDRKAEGQFAIRSLYSGKVIEVKDNKTEDGAKLQQWDYEDRSNQVWQLIPAGSIDPIP